MSVNVVFCNAEFTSDHLPLCGASVVGDPKLPLVRVSNAAKGDEHGALMFRYLGETGCRYGANDAGLFVGMVENYCKVKSRADGMAGMGAAQEVLSRCETASEALEMLTSLIGEGFAASNDGMQCAFYIESKSEAWILETVNELWAAIKAPQYNAMCGDFFIAANYDLACPAADAHPKAKKGKLDFNSVFSATGKASSSGVSIRRFLAVQTLYELINGQPSHGFMDLLLGRDKRGKAAGLDAAAMRLIFGARSKQVRMPIENMAVTPFDTGSFLTSGAAVYCAQTDIMFYTPGPVPDIGLYIPVSLQHAETDEQESAKQWLEWEYVRRSLESGALDSETALAALRNAQHELDEIYAKMLSNSEELKTLSAEAAEVARDCLAGLLSRCRTPFAKLAARGLRNRNEINGQTAELSKLSAELGLEI